MSTKSTNWSCVACDTVNPEHFDTCKSCSCLPYHVAKSKGEIQFARNMYQPDEYIDAGLADFMRFHNADLQRAPDHKLENGDELEAAIRALLDAIESNRANTLLGVKTHLASRLVEMFYVESHDAAIQILNKVLAPHIPRA